MDMTEVSKNSHRAKFIYNVVYINNRTSKLLVSSLSWIISNIIGYIIVFICFVNLEKRCYGWIWDIIMFETWGICLQNSSTSVKQRLSVRKLVVLATVGVRPDLTRVICEYKTNCIQYICVCVSEMIMCCTTGLLTGSWMSQTGLDDWKPSPRAAMLCSSWKMSTQVTQSLFVAVISEIGKLLFQMLCTCHEKA